MIATLTHLLTPKHTNNHRPRLLQPAGLAVLVSLSLVFNGLIRLYENYGNSGLVLGYASNISAEQVIQETNKLRVKEGLDSLKLSQALSTAAFQKAQDMFANDYWAHISPDGVTPWFFIKEQGYVYTVAGENLARDFDSTKPMMEAWMGSPTHRANIVHPKFEEIGVAVVNGKLEGVETTLVVQMFGSPATIAGAIEPSITPSASTDSNRVIESQELSDSQTIIQEEPQTAVLSTLTLKKSVFVAVVVLIMGVLIIDEIIIRRKKIVRFVGKNWAHLSFLAFVAVIIIIIIQPGSVL